MTHPKKGKKLIVLRLDVRSSRFGAALLKVSPQKLDEAG